VDAVEQLGSTRRPDTPAVAIVALALAGVGLLVVTAVLEDSTSLRVATFVGGALALYGSASRAARVRQGPRFELDLVLSAAWLGLVVFAAVFADLLPLAEAQDVSKTLRTPALLRPDLLSEHPLGTDKQGLDILGGVVYGARVSLVVGLGAVLVGMFIGGAIGIAAAFYGGALDRIVRLFTDAMLAFPALILLLAMVAVFGPSVRNVTIALAVLGIPTYIRLARANTLRFSEREFVLAARALGDRNRSIMVREILPNVALPVLSFGFIMVAVLIVAEASLSFLGLSVQRPTPTWGNMIAAGQADFTRHPHLVFIPGAVLFLTVYALNRLGDKARQMWTPKEGKT
jgi:peptide/nickel transport system permease protein